MSCFITKALLSGLILRYDAILLLLEIGQQFKLLIKLSSQHINELFLLPDFIIKFLHIITETLNITQSALVKSSVLRHCTLDQSLSLLLRCDVGITLETSSTCTDLHLFSLLQALAELLLACSCFSGGLFGGTGSGFHGRLRLACAFLI